MADADGRAEVVRGSVTVHERDVPQAEPVAIEVLAAPERDEVRRRVDARDVAALPERDAESATLADRVRRRARVLPDPAPVGVEERARRRLPARAARQLAPIVAVADEADLLALRLVGGREAVSPRDRAHVGLGEAAQREAGRGELVLAEAVEEVRLVLVAVDALEQPVAAPARDVGVLDRVDARVVPRRDGVARIEMAGPPEERAELHLRVAVDARARRAALQVGGQERIEDAVSELALEVEDVERDAQLAGHAARVLGGIERAAGAVAGAVRVGRIVQAHPDADDVAPLLHQEGRRSRRVHAAGHRDEHALGHRMADAAWLGVTCVDPARRRSTTRPIAPAAVSISASLVVRPEREPQRPSRLLGRVAHREQHVGRLERAGRAGGAGRAGDALEVERHHEVVADDVADDDRERGSRPGRPDGLSSSTSVDRQVTDPRRRSRRSRTAATVSGCSRAASSNATAIPTAAATSSVPARR